MEFAHLRVAAGTGDPIRAGDAEVFHHVKLCLQRRIAVNDRAALDRVEHLGRVEGEHGRVAEVRGADAVFLHAEGVRGVVDHLEPVLLRDCLDGVRVAEVAVDVHRDDRGGLGRDERLDLRGVHCVGRGVNVAENGL